MNDLPEPVKVQLDQMRYELDELEKSIYWRSRENLAGSRQLRSVVKRVVLSAKRLEEFVKEQTFSR